MNESIIQAREEGKKVSSLNILSLFPVPEKEIIKAAEGVKRVVIAEENFSGQYRKVISLIIKEKEIIGVNKIGLMIKPKEILETIL